MAAAKTFEAEQAWLKGRVNLPTSLTSAELALAKDFPARVKAQTFFSARVTSVNILEALRDEIGKFADGETDIASARMRLGRSDRPTSAMSIVTPRPCSWSNPSGIFAFRSAMVLPNAPARMRSTGSPATSPIRGCVPS